MKLLERGIFLFYGSAPRPFIGQLKEAEVAIRRSHPSETLWYFFFVLTCSESQADSQILIVPDLR